MGIRETLSKNPKITYISSGVAVLIGLTSVVMQLRGDVQPGPPTKGYFTDDDGRTFFVDDINSPTPYLHDGKQAVGASMMKGATGKPFIAYLTRHNTKAKANLESLLAKSPTELIELAAARGGGLEVKAPLTGDKGWVPATSNAGGLIQEIHRPSDVSEPIEPAFP